MRLCLVNGVVPEGGRERGRRFLEKRRHRVGEFGFIGDKGRVEGAFLKDPLIVEIDFYDDGAAVAVFIEGGEIIGEFQGEHGEDFGRRIDRSGVVPGSGIDGGTLFEGHPHRLPQ